MHVSVNDNSHDYAQHRKKYRLNTQHSLRKGGDINWTERESSLKNRVRLNVKHKTKEYAPGQTAAQLKSE